MQEQQLPQNFENVKTVNRQKRLSKSKLIKRMLFVPLGSLLVAVGLEIFLVPNNIIDGGIIGISILTSYLTNINLGILLVLFNLPFFIIGYKYIGKTFAVTTLIGNIILGIGVFLFHPVPVLTDDLLLASVFGGLCIGVGVGLVIRHGGSLDGTEILAILFNKATPFSVGEVVMFMNLFILGSAGFVFGWDRAMYSLIAYFIAYKTIDVTIEGLDQSKSVWIISDHHKEIGDALNDRLGRGVTYLHGEGAYTGDDKRVIFTVITRLEEAKVKSIVEDKDESAFLAVGDIHDVKGGRFKKKAIH
ncbi:YitT family protein [Virgibacillus sp. DJP39]|uniref:YitT family protein n=1 Tax=Virgibacillus sp. DJP39 TaxID=3409790 RepID=UPI003BB63F16